MGNIFHQQTVFFAAGLIFPAIHHQVMRLFRAFARKGPLLSRGKSCSTPTAKTGLGDFFSDLVGSYVEGFGQSFVAASSAVLLKTLPSLDDAVWKKDTLH
jgi:hypothetical protein